MTCSVCIPTYRRADELRTCLAALVGQTVPPDEIIVSDAGGDAEHGDPATRAVLDAFRDSRAWTIRHCPTRRSGLPWQRWWAFQHATGDVAVFIDDDMRLAPEALAVLLDTYRRMPDIVGAGFAIAYDGRGVSMSHARTLRERWLGIASAPPGSITTGGITIELPLRDPDAGVQEVEWLHGGAMSYRRDALAATAPLDRLFELYDARIGKAEDSLLSTRVRRQGRLVLIAGPYAWHPALEHAKRTESPQDGYHKGLLETWGRAHVLRWLARDPASAFRAWLRVASLELARAVRALAQRPVAGSRWLRIVGGFVGIQRTILRWDRIPPQPDR